MELFEFYLEIRGIAYSVSNDLQLSSLLGTFGGAGLWLVLFVLQGFGLLAMAKRLKLRKKWLSFVPFANVYYMGKIVGQCQFFGQKVKNIGLYTMIGQIVCFILGAGFIFTEGYLAANYAPTATPDGYLQWAGLTGFAGFLASYYEWGQLIISIPSLITRILMLVLMTGLLRKYMPASQMFLTLLVFFLPISRFIIIFVARNKEPFDYEAYMRRRREEYMRQRQQYYNTYGNPYGGSPYGMGGYQGTQQPQQPQQSPQEDPFGEFSSGDKPKGDNEPSTGDGFFD